MFGQYLEESCDLRRLWDNRPLFVVMDGGIYNNANCRAPELENSADCDVQVKLLITVRYLTRLSLHDDHPNLWRYSVSARANEKVK